MPLSHERSTEDDRQPLRLAGERYRVRDVSSRAEVLCQEFRAAADDDLVGTIVDRADRRVGMVSETKDRLEDWWRSMTKERAEVRLGDCPDRLTEAWFPILGIIVRLSRHGVVHPTNDRP